MGTSELSDRRSSSRGEGQPLPTFQCGRDPDCKDARLLPPGLFSDFMFYSANNHPLHGIFACDPENALSWIERVVVEVTTVGLTLFAVFFQEEWVQNGNPPKRFPQLGNPWVFSVVMVTLPGILIWWTLFLLFTCPWCGQIDRSRASASQIRVASYWSWAGACLGYALFGLGIAAIILPRVAADLQECGGTIFYGRLRGYVITWMLMVFVYFNPFIAWGQPNPNGPMCFGDYIGLGQWRIEKQRFQALCRDAVMIADSEVVE